MPGIRKFGLEGLKRSRSVRSNSEINRDSLTNLNCLPVVLVGPAGKVAQVGDGVLDVLRPCMQEMLAFRAGVRFNSDERDCEGAPPSRASRAAIASAFCSIKSASLYSSRPLSEPGTFRPQEVLDALRAAWTAKSTSLAVPRATLVITVPSAVREDVDEPLKLNISGSLRTRVVYAGYPVS